MIRNFTKVIFFILVLSLIQCGRGGSGSPADRGLPVPQQTECAPGARAADGCPDGGPEFHDFHVKDRRAEAPSGPSAFYSITAERIAVSPHFVMYREQGMQETMSAAGAKEVLARIESSHLTLKEVFGSGTWPDIQTTGRVVLLAYDIKDDYSPLNPSYISGFFAPRDLFADEFTSQLFENPELIKTYGDLDLMESADTLQGRSNEVQMVYLDLSPFYDGTAFGGDKEKARTMFCEAALHESSHLFVYYKRVLVESVKNHLPWIAEGLAEQAPRMLAGLDDGQAERLEQYALPLVRELIAASPSLLDLNSSGNPLAGYVLTNLFFNYLRHRAGSAAAACLLLEDLVNSEDESVFGVDLVLSGFSFHDGGHSFAEIFGDWVITNWLCSTGRTPVSLVDEAGTIVPLGDGTNPSRLYDLSYQGVGIGKKGEGGLAFGDNSLPLSGEGMVNLLPASFLYHSYTPSANETYIPLNNGMEEGVKIALARLLGAGDVELTLYDHDSVINLTAGEQYHVIVYNPNFGGAALSTGQLPWDIRNLSSWLGEGKTGWQRGIGAKTGTADSWFYRTTGIALSLKLKNGGNANYLYTADSINHGISRWNIDTGAFAGRMGSKSVSCGDDGSEDDGWHMSAGKLASNYCRRNFSSPQGIAVDSSGFIYIADRNNHRVVKRDRDGKFVAWLGSTADDSWQTLSMETPGSPSYSMDAKAFNSPFGLALDEGSGYLYVSCYGSGVVSRRSLATGQYEGFIGNGEDEWNTALAVLSGQRGSARNYFSYPRGIAVSDGYLYIADEGNHRVSRWTLEGFNGSMGGNGDMAWIGGGVDGWHALSTAAGTEQERRMFNNPADVYCDGSYLYVADRMNQRIARWALASGVFGGWIGGGITQWETNTDGPVQEPVGNAYAYPSIFMLQPQGVVFAAASDLGSSHSYLFLSTVYNARLSRWNLDCVEDNIGGDCGSD